LQTFFDGYKCNHHCRDEHVNRNKTFCVE
ncbi:hypothetical protein D031_1526B, partial [Vibrio parahaemolyticus VP-48]